MQNLKSFLKNLYVLTSAKTPKKFSSFSMEKSIFRPVVPSKKKIMFDIILGDVLYSMACL